MSMAFLISPLHRYPDYWEMILLEIRHINPERFNGVKIFLHLESYHWMIRSLKLKFDIRLGVDTNFC